MTEGALLLDRVFYIPTDDGTYVMTPAGARRLTGRSVAAWLDRLAPLLDGTHTMTALLSSVPEDRREHLGRLLDLLVEHDVVTVIGGPTHAGPSRLVVVGLGELLWATVSAAAVVAPGRVRAVDLAPEELAGEAASPAAAMRGVAGRSGWQSLELDELAATVDRDTVVVHIHQPTSATGAEPERSGPGRRVSTLCQERGAAVTDCLLLPDQVWISPAGGLSLVSALARWRSPISEGVPRPAQAGITLAGAIAVQTASRPPSDVSALVSVHLDSLQSHDHRVLPHPFEQPAGPDTRQQYCTRVARLAGSELIPLETFSRNMTKLTDTGFGIIDEWTEKDYVQQPLRVTSTRVVDSTRSCHSSSIVESGADFEDARHRAALRALAGYSWRILDPRRLHDSKGAGLVGPDVEPADALEALRGARGAGGWMWCNDLRTNEAQLIEAARVFGWLTGGYDRAPRGVAAGYSWDEALRAGLLDHCVELLTEAAGRGAIRPRKIDLATAPLDDVSSEVISARSVDVRGATRL